MKTRAASPGLLLSTLLPVRERRGPQTSVGSQRPLSGPRDLTAVGLEGCVRCGRAVGSDLWNVEDDGSRRLPRAPRADPPIETHRAAAVGAGTGELRAAARTREPLFVDRRRTRGANKHRRQVELRQPILEMH